MPSRSVDLVGCTMRSLLQNTHDFMFVKDLSLRYVGSSLAFAVDCAGVSGVDRVVGKTDYEIFSDPAFAQKYRKDDLLLLETLEPLSNIREEYPDKDGRRRYCLTSKHVIFDEDGAPVGIFGQCRDITEQVEAEREAERNRQTIVSQEKVFDAFRSVFHECFYWDLAANTYHVISYMSHGIIPPSGVLDEIYAGWLESEVPVYAREEHADFFDLSTLSQRLTNQGIQICEVRTSTFGWLRILAVPVERDADGMVTSCLWISEEINFEKERDLAHREALVQAKRAAEIDALTGLLNRGGSEYKICEMIAEGACGLLCLIDVNNFKHINDTYGHVVGDAILQRVAQCLERGFRKGDIVARFGGDEFVAFAPGIDQVDDAELLIARLSDAIEEQSLSAIGGEQVRVSIGGVLVDGMKDALFKSVYEVCDEAMYRCKNNTERSYCLVNDQGDHMAMGTRRDAR